MHPNTAKSLIGLENRLDRGQRLSYLPGTVYGDDAKHQKIKTAKPTTKKARSSWTSWLKAAFQYARP